MKTPSAFINELNKLNKPKFAAQTEEFAPQTPEIQVPQPPQVQTPEFGPTLANEAQLPVEQRTQDASLIGVPDFDAPYIYPEAARAFEVAQNQVPTEEVIPRGGVRTRGTGGEQSPMAAARLGGIAKSESEFGFLPTLRKVINPSDEQKAANLAAGARTGGVQVLPEEPAAAVVEAPVVTEEPTAITEVAPVQEVTPEVAAPVTTPVTTPVAPNAPMGEDETRARLGGQTLSQYLANDATSGTPTDAQGRMIDPSVNRSSYLQESANREARQAARPDFGVALSDSERRDAFAAAGRAVGKVSGGGLIERNGESFIGGSKTPATPEEIAKFNTDAAASRTEYEDRIKAENPSISQGEVASIAKRKLTMAAATRLTGGNRAEARAMIERQKQGMGEFKPKEVKEKDESKSAAQLTGIELDNELKRQVIEKGSKPDATKFDIWNAELELSGLTPAEKRAARLKKFGLDAFDFPEGSTASPVAPTSPSVEAGVPIPFNSIEEAQAANLPSGTRVNIRGKGLGTI
tara:strand:- start:353 stop:1912 length:1560 start_codon:yes stop_codon:yes gene_type:complete